ncbi:pyruvate kinase [Chloroflexia bacterium SDU3-3]|nr:pyruvate kinase [Chloroflexia bacterium SDU3-3]
MRRTKIVATIGPVSESAEMLDKLIAAGMNVARMNFSHGEHSEHADRIARVRAAGQRAGRAVAVLQDLQGPKIRTGKLINGGPVTLTAGQRFIITVRNELGTAQRVSTTYTPLPQDVKLGDNILISDGLIRLRVVEIEGDDVVTEVVAGGVLRERQGINLPGVNVSAPSLTEKDIVDLEFGLSQNVDLVALSFVRSASNVEELRRRIQAAGKSTPIIAKIEKPEALDDLDNIISAVDGVMVARGDLGVEIPAEQVPIAQKRIIDLCNRQGKPVITATQMLDSMIRNPQPTRAEASDVANAILDGTDAVMLSGETAVGAYPVESIEMMARIAEVTESSILASQAAGGIPLSLLASVLARDPISVAAHALMIESPVTAIVAFTVSGATALRVARQRPHEPIFVFTPSEVTYRWLSVVWGLKPILCRPVQDLVDLTALINRELVVRGLMKPGETVVMTGGHPTMGLGRTDFVKMLTLS